MLGNFYSAGQVCSNGTRVFVQRAIRDAFLDRLVARTERIVTRRPHGRGRADGPAHLRRAGRARSWTTSPRAAPKARSSSPAASAPTRRASAASSCSPPSSPASTDGMTIAREEIFGPVACVLDFDERGRGDRPRQRHRLRPRRRRLHRRPRPRPPRRSRRLQAGTTWINAYNLTPVEAPFGGVKASGLGRENGRAALDHWSQVKSVYVGLGPVAGPLLKGSPHAHRPRPRHLAQRPGRDVDHRRARPRRRPPRRRPELRRQRHARVPGDEPERPRPHAAGRARHDVRERRHRALPRRPPRPLPLLARGPGRARAGRHVGRMGQDDAAAELPAPGLLAHARRRASRTRRPAPPSRRTSTSSKPASPAPGSSAPTSPSPTSRSASPLYRYFTCDLDSRRDRPQLAAYYARLCERPAYAEHVMVNYDVLKTHTL